MKHYVGLDVSDKETSVCIVDETGRPVWQGRCLSTPDAIAAAVRAKAPHAERVGIETGPLSTWHWHGLKELGLPVVCLDARHAKAALSLQTNKTDANDALGLAQIVRTGWYREVQVKTMDAHLVRALIVARAELVAMHRDLSNQMRGVLKVFGLVVGHTSHGGFGARVRDLVQDGPELLGEVVGALLAAWEATGEQLNVLHRRLLRHARSHDACRRLMCSGAQS